MFNCIKSLWQPLLTFTQDSGVFYELKLAIRPFERKELIGRSNYQPSSSQYDAKDYTLWETWPWNAITINLLLKSFAMQYTTSMSPNIDTGTKRNNNSSLLNL